MRNLKQSILISTFLLLSMMIFAQNNQENNQMTIAGTLISHNGTVSNEKIMLYEGDNAVETTTSNDLGFFEFSLDYDKLYHVVFGSKKYEMKWITIGTNIPKEDREEYHMANLVVNIAPRPENPDYVIVQTLAQK